MIAPGPTQTPNFNALRSARTGGAPQRMTPMEASTGAPGALVNPQPAQGLKPQGQGGTFSATSNLINRQFGDVRYNPSSGLTNAIAGIRSASQYRPSGATQGFTGMMQRAAGTLFDAPNRGQLAADAFSLMRERSQPGFEQALRGVGQRAAALGRVGAGMTTSELGDVTLQREKALGQEQRQLANEAAGLEMQDRLSRMGAVSGAQGQLAGQGLQATQLGLQGATSAAGLQQAIDQMRYNADVGNRNFAAGERGYQYGLSRDAQQDRINERLIQEQLQQGQHGREMDKTRLGAQLGWSQNPAPYEQYGGAYGSQNAMNTQNSAADLAQYYAQMRARNAPTAPQPGMDPRRIPAPDPVNPNLLRPREY